MALRMNLWGVDFDAVEDALGSKRADVLSAASDRVAELLTNEESQSQAKAWLTTLITNGHAKKSPPEAEEPGGLLRFLAESEDHVFAMHALIETIGGDGTLNLSAESSEYHHGAFPSLISDMRACRFSTSEDCTREFLQAYSDLYRGTPMFGHRFESSWSFYSIIRKPSLDFLLDGFAAAKSYERHLGESVPPEASSMARTRVSEQGIQFVDELHGWFRQVRQANLDAYVIWW